MYILSKDEKSIEWKTIEYVPGFYKIFDEIIVNAADNFYVNYINYYGFLIIFLKFSKKISQKIFPIFF